MENTLKSFLVVNYVLGGGQNKLSKTPNVLVYSNIDIY